MLFLAEWSRHHFYQGAALGSGLATMGRETIGVLLPLNLVWLALGREKGLVNISGLVKLLLIIVQPPLVVFLYLHQPKIPAYLRRPFLSLPFLRQIDLAQAVIAAYLLSFVVLAINLLRQRGAVAGGFFWAPVASYFSITVHTGLSATICLMLGGVILVVAVVEAAYTMAMLDIDFFKKFNDSYGHGVGDQVLEMVAGQIAKVTGGGLPFRYGGEEFAVDFSGQKAAAVVVHLERIRKAVAAAVLSRANLPGPSSPLAGEGGAMLQTGFP